MGGAVWLGTVNRCPALTMGIDFGRVLGLVGYYVHLRQMRQAD